MVCRKQCQNKIGEASADETPRAHVFACFADFEQHKVNAYTRGIPNIRYSSSDNDNDTLREVPHLSNEGLALHA